jgi:hypothetical protein
LLLLSLRVILAISLYAFLFWAVRITWAELKKAARDKIDPTIPPLSLIAHQDTDEPIYYDLTKEVNLIGRAAHCDIIVRDETVSSHHGRIYYESGQWWFQDLNSSNGSFLEENRVDRPAVLTNGDALRLGRINFQIIMSGYDQPGDKIGDLHE